MNYGQQKARMIPCARSQWHRFHPENEACPECPVASFAPSVLTYSNPQQYWRVDTTNGCVFDAARWKVALRNPRYVPLSSVLPGTIEAKRICGCDSGGPCSVFARQDGATTSPCYRPDVVKHPDWSPV